ncbi:MAG: hypothetical protein EAZ99_02425 [Alphaproteobacteria bacterium]|nr:DUF5368 family protein [Alphaproteobacteria bacterium]TAD91525.1 MAG: hypothetical protein EAZ99_02425 [Alphaproteobacteria bacterium]
MKELTFAALWAVFHEMLGAWLYLGLAAAVAFALAVVVLVIRERGVMYARLVRCYIIGLIGGFSGVFIAPAITLTSVTAAGGPADWVLLFLVWVVGAIGSTIVLYTLVGWIGLSRRQSVPVAQPALAE